MRRYSPADIRAFVSAPRFDLARPRTADSSLPRITVVTPSFNQAAYLERTLLSVLNQGYGNLEYLVMDGGSSDGSVEIIRRYQAHLAYWVSEKDQGHADALAKGFARATGSVLAFLNSDDLYLPGALAAAGEIFGAPNPPDVLYGNTYRIGPSEEIAHEHRQSPFLPRGYLYGACDLQQPSVFWTAEIFRRVGGVDPTYFFAFDTHLFFRFVAAGARFRFRRQFLSCFRVHPASKTGTVAHIGTADMVRLRAQFTRYAPGSLTARGIWLGARLIRMGHCLTQGDGGWMARRLWERALGRDTP